MTGFLFVSVFLSMMMGACCETETSHYVAMLQSLGAQATSKIGSQNVPAMLGNSPRVSLKSELFAQFSELSMREVSEILHEAVRTVLEEGLAADGNVSALCQEHFNITLHSLLSKQEWAIRMLDATGKIAPGLLLGNTNWEGQYDECVSVVATIPVGNTSMVSTPFRGKYCTVGIPIAPTQDGMTMNPSIPLTDLGFGLCVPDSCDINDLKVAINKVLSQLPYNWTHPDNKTTFMVRDGVCQQANLDYDTRAIFAITFLGILGGLIVIATLYDMFVINHVHRRALVVIETDSEETAPLIGQISSDNGSRDIRHRGYGSGDGPITVHIDPKSPSLQSVPEVGLLGRLLLSFSIYTNGPKLMDTRPSPGTLGSIHGIRFISMSWVVLGHTFVFNIGTSKNITDLMNRFQDASFMAIANATVSVDTFFLLSGLLVSYLSLREVQRVGGVKNFRWLMFYFHRFWRLTPPYMLVMLLYVPLYKYWYNGPFWNQNGIEKNYCEGTWWRNLLYINNFFPARDMCMGWSWYLSNDMQFFVIAPVFIIPLFIHEKLGVIVTLFLLLASWVTTGIISTHYQLAQGLLSKDVVVNFEQYYVKPYCRVGPYIIGVLCGYILYKTDLKLKISRMAQCIGWMVAAGCCLSVLYANYDVLSNRTEDNPYVSALYNTLARSAWAMGVSWVILVCATGYGGWVNKFLSWSAFIPLSRLTYVVYLIHPVILTFYYTSRRDPIYVDDIQISYMFLGHMCVSYAIAIVISLALESPFMALEKVLFQRNKGSNK